MRLKKSTFGNITLFLGIVIMSVYLYTLFVSLLVNIEKSFGKNVFLLGINVSVIGGGILCLISVGLFFLISLIKSKIRVNDSKGGKITFSVFYWFFFALLFSYGLFVRITGLDILKNWDSLKTYTERKPDTALWKNLLNLFYGDEVHFENFFHKLYSYIAAMLLRIFGDSLTVPAVLNIIMYMLSAVLLFMAARYIFGRVPALFSFAFLMLSMSTHNLVYDISGFNLFLLTLALFAFLVTYFLDVYTGTKPVMCFIVATVAFAGALVFTHFLFKPFALNYSLNTDILTFTPASYLGVSVAVLVFALFAYLSYFKNSEDETSFATLMTIVLLVILMFDNQSTIVRLFAILIFWVLAGIGADNLFFKHYKLVHVTEEIEAPETSEEVPMPVITDAVDVVLDESTISEDSLKDAINSQIQTNAEIASDIPEEFARVVETDIPEEYVETPVDGTLAETELEEVVTEPVSEAAVDTLPETPATEVTEQVTLTASDIVTDTKTEDNSIVTDSSVPETEPEAPVKKRVPAFFETPLPMPKKHVKKTADYAFEPAADQMKYDVEISPDDDFDIK